MAKSMKGAGGFSQMPKMMTDEPSVILKLKKGGHVAKKEHHKEEHGHKSMHHMMDGGVMRALAAPRVGMAPPMAGAAPMKPSLAMRRKAMATPLMKKGGKAHHHHAEGGDIAQDKAMIKKAFKEHDAQEHKGGKGTKLHLKHGGKAHKFAKGGATGEAMDKFETKTTIERDEKPYVQTKMDTAKRDTAHGTGSVKEGNAGGFKHGGKIHHHKHGGKVHHISGHPEGTEAHHKHMAKHHAAKHKEGGSAHHHKMHEHHKHLAKMCKGGAYATGGTVGSRVPADTNEGNTAGKVVMGGTIEGNEHYFENTDLHSARRDNVSGTGGVKMSNAGGFKHGGKAHMKHGGKTHHYKKGGSIDAYDVRDTVEGGNWENRPADTTPKGKTNTKTGEVKEANAGGYKRGGHAAKKHFATGGSVNHMGSAVAMPQGRKPASRPVHINELSGTFKKGGRVKKLDVGGPSGDAIIDRENARREAELNTTRYENEHPFRTMFNNVKDFVMGPSTSPAGSVTKTEKSVTVAPPKKRGGSVRR